MKALRAQPSLQQALSGEQPGALEREAARAAAREAADRRRAREALRKAAEAARQKGDSALAERLQDSARLLRRRGARADAARQLMGSMPQGAGQKLGRALQRLERTGQGEALEAQLQAMKEAWQRLSPEQRKRLAEALADAPVTQGDGESSGAKQGDSPEPTVDELEEQLRRALANLDHLQKQIGSGQSQGGALPVPTEQGGGPPVSAKGGAQGRAEGGQTRSGDGQAGSARAGQAGAGAGGTGEDQGVGASGGRTPKVAADDGPLARVRPLQGEGSPSAGSVQWVDPEGASPPSAQGSALPGQPAKGEAAAIERERIPRSYRDQVRVYFGGRRQGAAE
jgi:colicin import membrane protein